MLQQANWLTARAHFKGKPQIPKPIRRPGDTPDPDRIGGGTSYTIDQMRNILDNWGNGADDDFEAREVT